MLIHCDGIAGFKTQTAKFLIAVMTDASGKG